MSDLENFLDQADHDYDHRRDEIAAAEHADRQQFAADAARAARAYTEQRPAAVDVDPFPAAPADRHVLIVEPSGFMYVAPHVDDRGFERCREFAVAFEVFKSSGTPAPGPGRYWADVDDDGNFEIGGQVVEP